MKNFKQFNEDYGLFDKIKGNNAKNKLNNALKNHGYNSEGDFIRDVDKINTYADVLGTDKLSNEVSIPNIQQVYLFKQKYEEMFEVIDELDMLLREIKDEGIQVDYRYYTNYITYKGGSPSHYSGYQGYTSGPVNEDRRNFQVSIQPKEMNPSNLYIIFGVLMEAEGRGEISFQNIQIIRGVVYAYVFIDDDSKEQEKSDTSSREPNHQRNQYYDYVDDIYPH